MSYLQVMFIYCNFISTAFAQHLTPRNSSEITGSGIGIQTIWHDLGPIRKDITEKMFEAGIKWCRVGVPWGDVEPDSIGYYNFTSIDTIIGQLVEHSITPYLVLSDPNVLYNPNRFPPIPESTSYFSAWLAYVDTVVKRYHTKVNHWEIWNEPNMDEVWRPASNPAQYSALVCSTAKIIRAIDANTVISLGGTALVDIKFIKSCLENGVGEYIDKIAIHPYRTLPEAPQNLLVFKPNTPFESPYTSYEEEIRALKDTIALFSDSLEIWDTEGCFLSDSIYPDPLSPDPFNPQHSSQITQAKYLARRYILNLKQGIEITTWTVDWDMRSLTNNIGRTDWVNDYSERTDFDFGEAPFCGIVYTPQDVYTFTSEGEDYTGISLPMETIYDPLASGDSCIWTPNGIGDSGYAYYDFCLSEGGWFTTWSRSVGNGDSISLFIVGLDTLWFGMGNWYSPGEYRWTPVAGKFLSFFNLAPDSHRLYVCTYWDGSRLDIWKLVKVDTNCICKKSYYTLQNICSVFDNMVRKAGSFSSHFENINVDSTSFNKLTYANFEDTVRGGRFIAYWLGVEAEDNYTDKPALGRVTTLPYAGLHLNLIVNDTTVSSAALIDFVSGSVNEITNYTVNDTSITFDSLPVADFPYCVALNWRVGIQENVLFGEQGARLEIYPNPFVRSSIIKYSLMQGTDTASIPKVACVELKIYNLSGQLVRRWIYKEHKAGSYEVKWDGRDDKESLLPSGIYFIKLKVGEFSQTKKLLLLRK